MFEVTRVLDAVAQPEPADWAAAIDALSSAATISGAEHFSIAPTSPGTINGGDLIVRLRFRDPSEGRRTAHKLHAIADASAAVRSVHGADYFTTDTTPEEKDNGTRHASIYRALLIRVSPETPADMTCKFEADLLSMPKYIPSIVRWRLSRVSDAVGPIAWTHVWEQEFTDVEGLLGEYMDHPVHWGIVDRWFDPECPDMIVRDRVCHTFCEIDSSILATNSGATTDANLPVAESH
ncbi:MAG: Stress responsive Barrel Domain [Rhodococcus erythropolis]|jgi:hypothetical protein|uniref:Dabb family protein n=1 Tax=Rhodococcus qingshengii TaxID=334542 RepID=UPI00242CE3A6|nr:MULTISPECIES: Dabb family protein [Rhodococcus erythropolis group]MDF2894203.1 Stress responsive Barrel Domain [Rhodococcus erythropolis]MDT9664611.1 Dabb family protein [Rhodococcus qingshengii]